MVVFLDGDVFIVYQLLFDPELFDEGIFSFIAEFRFSGSLIFDRKALVFFTILSEQSKESYFPNALDLLDIFSFDFMFETPFQKVSNLFISKFFVHLNHSLEPPFLVQGYNISGVYFSSLN